MSLLKRVARAVPVVVPALEEVSPAYAVLVTKRSDLEARRSAIERESRRLQKGATSVGLSAARSARALALLGADMPEGAAEISGPTIGDMQARYSQLQQEHGDISTALTILDKRIEAEKRAAAKTVCEAIRKPHGEAIRKLALALRIATVAHRDLLRITNDLDVADVSWLAHLPQPQNLRNFFGDLSGDYDAPAQRFINDARNAGLVTENDLERAENEHD